MCAGYTYGIISACQVSFVAHVKTKKKINEILLFKNYRSKKMIEINFELYFENQLKQQ